VEAAIDRFRVGDPGGAEEILEKVVASSPEDPRAWELLGRARIAQLGAGPEADASLRSAALSAFGKALELDGERVNALYGAAAVHASEGRGAEALGLLLRLRDGGRFDLSGLGVDPSFEGLRENEGFRDLLMKSEDFADPFVEEVRVLHEWRGEAAGDEFGWIARNLGDVDGDGVADVVASAPSKAIDGPLAGRVYVYSGRTGDRLWTASGAPGDELGRGVEAAGDVDGDGLPDVAAGAPGGDRVVIYGGADGRVIHELRGQGGERFGQAIAGVGDLDGDGRSEVLVGAPRNDAGGEDAGRAVVVSGADGSELREWRGSAPGDRFGAAVAGAVVGDRSFVLVGSPDADPPAADGDRGRVYQFRGTAESPERIFDSDDQGGELGGMFLSVVGDVDGDGVADVYLSDWAHGALGPRTGRIRVHSGADGSELLRITGEVAGDGFGIGPADAGDVDGDGHDDLVVGAWQHAGGAPSGGKVYLYSGKDGTPIRAITGRVMGDTFGFDATGMGDVDGDGTIDLLLTSAWSAVEGPRSGRIFLIGGD
ncbi:MAG: FG-GAP-like repeat-containing protein, partial [Acidobacteriota bacterium]